MKRGHSGKNLILVLLLRTPIGPSGLHQEHHQGSRQQQPFRSQHFNPQSSQYAAQEKRDGSESQRFALTEANFANDKLTQVPIKQVVDHLIQLLEAGT